MDSAETNESAYEIGLIKCVVVVLRQHSVNSMCCTKLPQEKTTSCTVALMPHEQNWI